jgi:hypothetical protein
MKLLGQTGRAPGLVARWIRYAELDHLVYVYIADPALDRSCAVTVLAESADGPVRPRVASLSESRLFQDPVVETCLRPWRHFSRTRVIRGQVIIVTVSCT